MPGQSPKAEQARSANDEPSRRQERAHRILDAASTLLQRWGYKKTTVDDIARQAGVAKGTIYLHWKTREDLFVALLIRESLTALQSIQQLIDNDPQGMYLSHMTQHTMEIIMARPLSRALFSQDIAMLGELLHSGQQDLDVLSHEKLVASEQLLLYFREKGALRTDRPLREQIIVYSSIVIGFMTIDQYLPVEYHSSPAESTKLLGQTLHEVMEPEQRVAQEVEQELRASWTFFFQQYTHLLEERLHLGLS